MFSKPREINSFLYSVALMNNSQAFLITSWSCFYHKPSSGISNAKIGTLFSQVCLSLVMHECGPFEMDSNKSHSFPGCGKAAL